MTRSFRTTIPARRPAAVVAAILAVALPAWPGAAQAQKEPPRETPHGVVERSAPVTPFVFDGDVRDLPQPIKWRPGDPVKEIPRRFYPPPGSEQQYAPSGPSGVDPLYELQLDFPAAPSAAIFTAPSRSFPGQGYTGVNPPDTAGDVGPNHYIQMVNAGGGALVAIYDKDESSPNLLASFALESLGSGQCASGFGDPIVLYDRLADRWMLSEFSSSGNNLCVYISQTPDPVSGGWFNYTYTAPSFPDYPKYGVWPTDANGGQGSIIVTANDGGPGIFALDRGAMLAGTPGTYQRVTIPGLPGFGFEAPTPADLDGPTPPGTGSPAIIMRHRDTENHSGPAAPGDLLEMWTFNVDWVTPSNSVLVNETPIDVAEFDSSLCGLTSFFCFPQPSGPTLDPLREVIMNRLVYFNYGSYESLVGNFVTDVDGNDLGGIRWFELRRTGGAWSLHQEGTYSIDSDSRWMAASGIDQSGNIAVAYNLSSTSTFPSLRYTGRLADDPLGVMTQAESVIHPGTAANSSNRYGDYSAMNLDPVDDCTFWFTGMDNTSSNWRTQIASFGFDACGCTLEPPAPSASAVVGGDNRIDVSWGDSSVATVQVYRVRRALQPGGPFETIAAVSDTSPDAAGGMGYVFPDTDVSGGTTYYYVVLASDGAACTSAASSEVNVTATGDCTLTPEFDGIQSVTPPFETTCELDLAWNTASARCAGPVTYDIYRSVTPDFMPDITNLLVAGVSGTTWTDVAALDSGTRYYYIVRAVDQSNGAGEDNIIEASGVPFGTLTTGTWIEDGGDTGGAKMILEGTWSVDDVEGDSGPKVYKTGSYGNLTCDALTTPTLQLGASSFLSFSSKYDIENSWDKGEVQISNDGGNSWQRLEVGYPGSSTNASDNCGLPTGSYFTGTDLTFSAYGADLSAWSGQLVKIRFLISSDGGVTESGWWIDDIGITDVDVPGECLTGSSCEENPFVGVDPDGPLVRCEGEDVVLTAGLSGGTGPFSYQWTRDGLNIPGASSSTYVANDTETHAYNVKVRADTCGDDAIDGNPTVVEWRNSPSFDGLNTVESGLDTVCAISVSWDPATTPCDGPVSYSIYRDTTTPVAIMPANLIRSGLTTTSFLDTGNLIDGALYSYVVRAVDNSTGQDDGNVVEAGAVARHQDAGLSLPLSEPFDEARTFADWTVTTDPIHDCGEWILSSSTTERPSAGDGAYALADNSACAPGEYTSSYLVSPGVDTDITGLVSMILGYDLYLNADGEETATVEVWDGSIWRMIWFGKLFDVNTHFEFDVTQYAIGNNDFKVRFGYIRARDDEWMSVDNVFLLADADLACSTSNVPPAAPDGSALSTPLRGDRVTPAGDVIDVIWDVSSCKGSDYNLIYGDLVDVSTYALSGSECSIGNSGNFNWSSVPAGDLFFLVVGADGTGVESSWGLDSAGNERNGAAASGECSTSTKDTSNICP